MTTRKQKFRNLYYVINADNIEKLIEYFDEFPDQDPCEKLTIGKQNSLMYHALDSDGSECTKFLIEKLTLEQMNYYPRTIVKSYKSYPDVYNCYLSRLKLLTEQTGLTDTITNLLFVLIMERNVIPKELVQEIIDIPHYDFENKIKYNTDGLRKRLEKNLPDCKSTWITFFIEYYISKNIDFKKLAVKLLLYNNIKGGNTFWKIIKKYWNLYDNSKFNIEFLKYDGESINQYTLQFIVFITCDVGQVDINEFTMFTDNSFEEQFNNYISEPENFHDQTHNLFSSIASINRAWADFLIAPIHSTKDIDKLKSVLKYLSNSFFQKIKEVNQKQIDAYIKKHEHIPEIFSNHNLSRYIQNIDDLHKEYLELEN